MFELSKKVLKQVSFDKMLFKKELTKAVNRIKPNEKMLLKMWCLTTFGTIYRDVILDVYKNVTNS